MYEDKGEKMMKKAFTLAEVLITLTIIGVIAAITIPNLMRKYEDIQEISGLKNAYSIFSNAFKQLISNEGTDLTGLDWPAKNSEEANANADYLLDKLAEYIKFDKLCHSTRSCMPVYSAKNMNGTVYVANYYDRATAVAGKAVLNNGMGITISIKNPNGYNSSNNPGPYAMPYIGYILVDINGVKGPNRFAYDIFYLYFDKDGLSTSSVQSNHYTRCYMGNSNQGYAPTACTKWILQKGNMDYKYRDVRFLW